MGIPEAIQALETFGPYAIVVFIAVAYYKKDRQYSELLEKMVSLIEEKTKADTKLESALKGLRDVIMVLTNRKD